MTGKPDTVYVLASASPRRSELLTLIGIPHIVRPADLDESFPADETPPAYVERLAREKAAHVAAAFPDAVVIGGDTTVVLGDDILAKPADADEAARMLERLSGRTHEVCTGVAVVRGGRTASGVERVAVTFRVLTHTEISDYVETGEPMDKAGAYGIQGFGATIVERVDGDYFSVMGLGLRRLIALLAEVGIQYRFGRTASMTDQRRRASQ
jgi:septum formation protein